VGGGLKRATGGSTYPLKKRERSAARGEKALGPILDAEENSYRSPRYSTRQFKERKYCGSDRLSKKGKEKQVGVAAGEN